MRAARLHERIILCVGASKESTFECLRSLIVRFLLPIVAVSLVIVVGRQIYSLARSHERAIELRGSVDKATQRSSSALQHIAPKPNGGSNKMPSEAAHSTLEAITTTALMAGIHLDSVESGVICDPRDAEITPRFQLSFVGDFSQLRDFYRRLNIAAPSLVVGSLIIERASSQQANATIRVKVCISHVTKTS